MNFLKKLLPSPESNLIFDPQDYRSLYDDVKNLSDRALRKHFLNYGIQEGRLGSRYAMREAFLTLINPDSSVLEIGPFTRPSIKGPKIKYFDLLDTNDLFDQAQLVGYEINEPPEIHYISPDGDLAVIPDTFQAVVSVAFRTIA